MAIYVGGDTRVIVQGITGRQGRLHTELMLKYGTRIVAGVTPGRGGEEVVGIPVYDTVKEALSEYEAEASIIFVPSPFALDASLEAIEGGIKLLVIITEGVPVKDAIRILNYASKNNVTVIGPNSPGIIAPDRCKIGIMPEDLFVSGEVGIVSRSGTLTYEIAMQLTKKNLGQSTCVGIGGDPVVGLSFSEVLEAFREDEETEVVVLVGEIGGELEEDAAKFIIEEEYPKPVIAFVAGRTAPPGKRMGHAGAIVMGNAGTAESKIRAFERAGVRVASSPSEIAELVSSEIQ